MIIMELQALRLKLEVNVNMFGKVRQSLSIKVSLPRHIFPVQQDRRTIERQSAQVAAGIFNALCIALNGRV